MKSYVYEIRNKTNGKIYIGKSNHPSKRWNDHLSIANTGKPKDGTYQAIHAAIRKYGVGSFTFEITKEFDSEDDALIYEAETISLAKQSGIQIYNLTDGGDGISGYRFSIAARQKMSNDRKGKPANPNAGPKISAALKGRQHSEAHNKAVSASKLGKPNPEAGIKNAKRFKGEKSNTAILKEIDVINIINLLNANTKSSVIAKQFGIHSTTISNIKTGKTWKHLNHLVIRVA